MFYIVGLGNPDQEYAGTRHNAGRFVLQDVAKREGFSDWKIKKDSSGKHPSIISSGEMGGKDITFVLPDSYMNNSGKAVLSFIKMPSRLKKLVVVYDDMDLPLGKIKISFDRSSGGHNGLESIIKSLRSREFVRIRIGVSPAKASGVAKKPGDEDKVIKFLLSKFKEDEVKELKKIAKKIGGIIETIVSDGYEKAMGEANK